MSKKLRKKRHRATAVTKSLNTPDTALDPEVTDEGVDWKNCSPQARLQILDAVAEDPTIQALYEQAEHEMQFVESVSKVERENLTDLNNDVKNWTSLDGGPSILNRVDGNRLRTLKQCYYLYYRNAYARNIIRAYTFLTLGSGVKVKFPNASPKTLERWDVIRKSIKWNKLVRNAITMTYLLGEWFFLRSPLTNGTFQDKITGRTDRKKLLAHLSNIDAEKIIVSNVSPLEIAKVILSPKNRELPVAYGISEETRITLDGAKKQLSADDVTHFLIDDLGADTRGRPILEPVLKPIGYHTMHRIDRQTMTAIRVRIPLIRKVPNYRKPGVKHAMETRGLPRAGTIALVDKDEIWEYPGGPTDGASAEKEERSILLQICAGVSLPEFLVTMDASNSNLASLLAAKGPLIPMIEEYREQYAEQFEDFLEELTGEPAECSFPSNLQDDILKLVQAYDTMYQRRVCSKATYQTALGLDPEEEDARIEDETLEEDDILELDVEPDPIEPDDEIETEEGNG